MTLDFPWAVDGRGRTADTDEAGHVRDLVEQVLLTAPGERVMRPDFGAGLLQLVFEPGGLAVAATTQYLVQGALERTLSEVITVEGVEVEAVDASLVVSVSYLVRATQARAVATLTVAGGVG